MNMKYILRYLLPVAVFFLFIPLRGMIDGDMEVKAANQTLPEPENNASSDSVRQAQLLSTAFRETSRKVIPSVVKVTIRSGDHENKKKNDEILPFGDTLPDITQEERIEGIGSGVVVDPSGIILTNNHVLATSKNIQVELFDGRIVTVDSVKRDPKSDLAVLLLKGEKNLPCLEFADSDTLEIGDWVLAIGNPFMLESSVSAGIVSAKRRFLGKKDRGVYIQTDAAVNPGNSGGPLVNLNGEIVGINTAIASLSGGYQGIGFAIPSNIAVWIMKQLIDKGKVERAFIGVTAEPLSYDECAKYGIPPRRGVRIGVPYKNSPAAKAGLQNNDVIVAIDDTDINSIEEFEHLVESADITRDHRLKILRGNGRNSKNVSIRMEIKPENYVGVPQTEQLIEKGKHYYDRTIGAMFIPMTPDAQKKLGVDSKSGAIVLSVIPSGIAWKAGLREGMLLLAINGKTITDTADISQYITKQALAKGITVQVQNSEGKQTLTLRKK